MNPSESFTLRAARWLTFASAVSIMLGIAPSQILLALALAALMLSGARLQLPPIKLPLGLFLLGTLISLATSGNIAAGLPQVRKIYVFCELLVVFSLLRDAAILRWLFLTWAGLGSITAIRGMVQFAGKVQQARALGRDFYSYYVGERITGFMSHWNTFSAQEMFALVMLGSFLLFAPEARRKMWLWISLAVMIGIAIVLGETRGIWLASAGAALYLVWFWRRWVVALVPVAIAIGVLAAPEDLRDRFKSIVKPSQVDSNEFRKITWSTGFEMIKKHPLLGVGPEGTRIHFDEYIPPEIPRPLPAGWYGHLHNIYLQYAAERGIPVLIIFLWLICKIVLDFWRGLQALPPGRSDRRYLLHGAIAVVFATLIEGVVEVNLGDSEVLAMFLVVVAAGYMALEKELASA